MSTTEIILAIAALTLPGLTFLAGVWLTQRRFQRRDSEERLARTLDTYLANARSLTTLGMHGLIKAGVGTLHNDREIRELIQRIVQHGETHPLGKNEEELQNVDLQGFFATARELGHDFISKGDCQEIIANMKQR